MASKQSPAGRTPRKSNIASALRGFGKSFALQKGEKLFSQDARIAGLVFIELGKIRLSVVSRRGKEVVVSILGPGDFLGDSVVTGHRTHATSAVAITECVVRTISKRQLIDSLHRNRAFSDLFVKFLVQRNFRIEADFVDQLFNSIEKRLARALLLLVHSEKAKRSGEIIPAVSQEVLARMVGTTRTRINLFMNRFRNLGYIDYNGGLRVSDSLVRILLKD